MSVKSLSPVNVPSLSADPTVPTLRSGDIYFNSTAGVYKVYNGTNWLTLTPVLVLGPSTTVPTGTPTGTIIVRTLT